MLARRGYNLVGVNSGVEWPSRLPNVADEDCLDAPQTEEGKPGTTRQLNPSEAGTVGFFGCWVHLWLGHGENSLQVILGQQKDRQFDIDETRWASRPATGRGQPIPSPMRHRSCPRSRHRRSSRRSSCAFDRSGRLEYWLAAARTGEVRRTARPTRQAP